MLLGDWGHATCMIEPMIEHRTYECTMFARANLSLDCARADCARARFSHVLVSVITVLVYAVVIVVGCFGILVLHLCRRSPDLDEPSGCHPM